MSATDLAATFACGAALPSEVLGSVLARARKVDALLNLFAVLDVEGAAAAAAKSDARWRSGRQRGPLDGVPVTIKDNLNVAGLPTAWGTSLFKNRIASRDETSVASLRAAGCIIIGKTNIPEFALGNGNTSSAAFGVTRNPWNPALTPGSSSGGAAAAVAAGVAPIALATDAGGSIRRPASCCGILGLKTSAGLIGRQHGLPPVPIGLGTVGALTRTVGDLALTLEVLQQPPGDRRSQTAIHPTVEPAEPGRLRIRYIPRFGADPVEPAVTKACAEAAGRLTTLGHDVVETDVPFDTSLLRRSTAALRDASLAWLLRDIDWRGQISARFEPMLDAGSRSTATDYVAALMNLQTLKEQILSAFADFDLIMTPSAAALPWAADADGPAYHNTFTSFANAAGLPALAIPCEFTTEEIPVGFQLVGSPGTDWLLIGVARAYESTFPWASRWPLSAENAW